MLEKVLYISHYALPAIAVLTVLLCFSALMKRRPVSLGQAKFINAASREKYPLVRRETSIGRNRNCDIVLSDPTVSRLHAVVVCTKEGWYITDLRSHAGIRVNGKKTEKKAFIKTGDAVSLGAVTLIFENKQG